jgi:hypothetical protein
VRLNDKGEQYFLNDEQIGAERERARQAVNSWCK